MRQRTRRYLFLMLGQKQHGNHGFVTVFSPLQLFPIPKADEIQRRFATIKEIKASSIEELKVIPESAYPKCFEDWKMR